MINSVTVSVNSKLIFNNPRFVKCHHDHNLQSKKNSKLWYFAQVKNNQNVPKPLLGTSAGLPECLNDILLNVRVYRPYRKIMCGNKYNRWVQVGPVAVILYWRYGISSRLHLLKKLSGAFDNYGFCRSVYFIYFFFLGRSVMLRNTRCSFVVSFYSFFRCNANLLWWYVLNLVFRCGADGREF